MEWKVTETALKREYMDGHSVGSESVSPETKPIHLLILPGTFTLPSHSAEIRLSRSKFLQLFFALDSRHVANTVSVTAMPNVTPKGKPVEGRKVEKLSAFI